MKPQLPHDEPERLEALRRYGVLDTPPERAFDDITSLAAHVCRAPISLVSLVDSDRQWFKSRFGLDPTLTETSRDLSFCAHTILSTQTAVVADTLADPRFRDNPYVTAPPQIRFYAAAPLATPEGYRVGTLCVMDVAPRTLADAQREALEALARQVMAQLEIRRLGAALLAADTRFQNLFGNLPIGIYQTTPDGRIVGANRSLLAMLGYSSFEDLAKKNLEQDFEAGYSRREFRERIERDGEIRGLEGSWTRRDGTSVWVRENARVVRAADGSVVCYEGTVEDLSDRKRIERAKDEIVSVVSHELRAPLTSIRGTLEWMAERLPGGLPAGAGRMLEIARATAARMARLIGDLLDIEGLESGRIAFDLRPQALGPLLLQAIEANEASARELGVRLALDLGDASLRVRVDADRFVQVLTNLLSNAARFSPPGGTVTVAVQRHAGGVRVSVADRGAGIPETFRSCVFERFARGPSADPRHRGGTGLGLSITRAIVDRFGGRIGFVTGPGGTTFHVDLPEHRGD